MCEVVECFVGRACALTRGRQLTVFKVVLLLLIDRFDNFFASVCAVTVFASTFVFALDLGLS